MVLLCGWDSVIVKLNDGVTVIERLLLLLLDHLLCHHEDDTKALLIIVKVWYDLSHDIYWEYLVFFFNDVKL